MDIPRERPTQWRKVGIGVVLVGLVVLLLARLGSGGTARTVQAAGVQVDSVRAGGFSVTVAGTGTAQPLEARIIAAAVAGRVEHRMHHVGDRVKAGDTLLMLSNPDVQLQLLTARQQLQTVKANALSLKLSLNNQVADLDAQISALAAQKSEAERGAAVADKLVADKYIALEEARTLKERAADATRRLALLQQRRQDVQDAITPLLSNAVSQVAGLEQIVAFQAQLERSLVVTAGMAGVVESMPLEDGQWIQSGSVLARIIQPDRLKFVVRISDADANLIAVGQAAAVVGPGDSVQASVARIEPATAGGLVNVELVPTGTAPMKLRASQDVRAWILAGRIESALFVGRPVGVESMSTASVFRVTSDGKQAVRVSVRFGRGTSAKIEVLAGLKAGDAIVVSDVEDSDGAARLRFSQ